MLRATSSSLWSGFNRAAERFPVRPALLAGGETLSYGELSELARRIAATLQARAESSGPALSAVLSDRSPTGFAGVLGTLMSGRGYVPLNSAFPGSRTRLMFELSGCRSLIADRASLDMLGSVLDGADDAVLVVIPDLDDVGELGRRWPSHLVLGAQDLEPSERWVEPASDPAGIAYLLFTSGSTGNPKGVAVTHDNVRAFLEHVLGRYDLGETDRFSQTFDTTFDLSVFDLFAAWECGAAVCCPSRRELLNPALFIEQAEISVWFSVPSLAVFMKRFDALAPGAFPSLRLSLFCGEPLPASVAAAWATAAPGSLVENLYGPTELTIACTVYRWRGERSFAECENGIVPIGKPFAGMHCLVVDEQLREVEPGQDGELLMTGRQMTPGYWNDPARTAEAFVVPPERAEVHYRTGDRVRRGTADAPMTHLGRLDSQIKIRGHRAEISEIEAVVRDACGHDGVVGVPWPVTDSGCDGVQVFIQAPPMDVATLREEVAALLPEYMVPGRFHFLDSLPLNVNGKFDRRALAERLERQSG
jgi:amino acid adenylation domain-containing protein